MPKDRKEESQRYHEKNKDAINARRRARRREDSEYRRKQDERAKKWREKTYSDPELRAEKNRKSCEWYKNSATAQAKAKEYRRQYVLPESTRVKKRTWVARRRSEHMEKLVGLLGGQCRICGLVDDPIVYDFHHRDPALKKFTISQYCGTVSWKSLWEEAQKCCLLCSHCHRKLTHGKIEQPDWTDKIEGQGSRSG